MAKVDYDYHEIETSDLSALDLRKEAKQNPDAVAYRIEVEDQAELAEALYVPGADRIGIASGVDAVWTDCSSAEEGIEMYFNDPDEYERRN